MVTNVAGDLDELRELLDKAEKRSPWTIYLRKNYPSFRDTIAGQPANWEAIAAWAESKGHAGGPIKPATARKAFERERVRRGEGRPKKVAAVTPAKPEREPTRGVRIFSAADPAPEPIPAPAVDAQITDTLNRLKNAKPWLHGEADPKPVEVAAKAEPTATYANSRMEEVMKSMEEAGRFTRPCG